MFLLIALSAAFGAAGPTWQVRHAVLSRSCTHPPSSRAVGGFDLMKGKHLDAHSSAGTSDERQLPYEAVSTPRPEHCLGDADLPVAWDWRNVTVASGVPVRSSKHNSVIQTDCTALLSGLALVVQQMAWY